MPAASQIGVGVDVKELLWFVCVNKGSSQVNLRTLRLLSDDDLDSWVDSQCFGPSDVASTNLDGR